MSQAAEDPTGPDGVTYALGHPIVFWDTYVSFPLVVTTHLDRDDDVIGPFESLTTVGGGRDPHR